MSTPGSASLSRVMGSMATKHRTFTHDVIEGIEVLFPVGEEVTGEDIRVKLSDAGTTPGHHNAWGAAINAAVRRGYLKPTGQYVGMVTPKSHARKTPLYIVAKAA